MELPDPERQRTAPESYRRTFRNAAIVLLALAIGALTLTLILVERWESTAGTSSAMDGSSAAGSENSPFTATMYYVAANGLGLVRREIEVHCLEAGTYREVLRARPGGSVRSVLLPDLAFDPARIFTFPQGGERWRSARPQPKQ